MAIPARAAVQLPLLSAGGIDDEAQSSGRVDHSAVVGYQSRQVGAQAPGGRQVNGIQAPKRARFNVSGSIEDVVAKLDEVDTAE